MVAGVVLWSASILIFIAGVRRGYGFAKRARPSFQALAGTMWIFAIAVLSLPVMLASVPVSLSILVVGYLSVIILDRTASLQGEAPRHFARLRPAQMLIAVIGLLALLLSGAR